MENVYHSWAEGVWYNIGSYPYPQTGLSKHQWGTHFQHLIPMTTGASGGGIWMEFFDTPVDPITNVSEPVRKLFGVQSKNFCGTGIESDSTCSGWLGPPEFSVEYWHAPSNYWSGLENANTATTINDCRYYLICNVWTNKEFCDFGEPQPFHCNATATTTTTTTPYIHTHPPSTTSTTPYVWNGTTPNWNGTTPNWNGTTADLWNGTDTTTSSSHAF